jgi:hypothetical protein
MKEKSCLKRDFIVHNDENEKRLTYEDYSS